MYVNIAVVGQVEMAHEGEVDNVIFSRFPFPLSFPIWTTLPHWQHPVYPTKWRG
jgi:hypothetical protein